MQTGKVIPKLLLVLILASSGGWWYWNQSKVTSKSNIDNTDVGNKKHHGGTGGGDNRPTPVLVERVKSGDIRVIQTALGTVTPSAVVTVTSRVNGQLTHVLFKEGQLVHIGELLAEIDPRPFQAALAQVDGQAKRDQALLRNSQIDLERYKTLQGQDSIASQQVDAQASLVQQYQGTVQADQGLVDNAKLQLSFTKIISPINGRIGLRQVDNGNNITTTNTIAVVNTVDPIQVVFTLPEDRVSDLVKRFQESKKTGKGLTVEAWDRGNTKVLAKGTLLSLDNQIDATSGTVKLKAQFTNEDSNLFPNQFVNVRLLSNTLQDVTTVANVAIQHGSVGDFVYKIEHEKNDGSKVDNKGALANFANEESKVPVKVNSFGNSKETTNNEPKDKTSENVKGEKSNHGKRGGAVSNVKVQIVHLGVIDGDNVEVIDGLRPGDKVIVSGIDKLKDNAKVTVTRPEEKPEDGSGKNSHRVNYHDTSNLSSDNVDDYNQHHKSHGADGVSNGNSKRLEGGGKHRNADNHHSQSASNEQ